MKDAKIAVYFLLNFFNMDAYVMREKITLGEYIAITINNLATIFYQNVFTVDGFSYIENESEMVVAYRVTGKRRPVLKMHITKLIKDKEMLNCFSREDVGEIGMLYGRLMEKKIQNKKIKQLRAELEKVSTTNNKGGF